MTEFTDWVRARAVKIATERFGWKEDHFRYLTDDHQSELYREAIRDWEQEKRINKLSVEERNGIA